MENLNFLSDVLKVVLGYGALGAISIFLAFLYYKKDRELSGTLRSLLEEHAQILSKLTDIIRDDKDEKKD